MQHRIEPQLDLAESGIVSTLAALDAVGLSHVGTARFPAESGLSIVTVNGVRLADLAYTRYSNTVLSSDAWRVNFASSAAQVAADVIAARAAGADVVVVSLHLSKELSPAPAPEDRQFVVDLTALAHVDLVVEHGPHVIQPVERVNGTWVYWSVGNFIAGMGTASSGKYSDLRTLDGLAATARFTETSPGSFIVEPWPVLLCTEPFTRGGVRAGGCARGATLTACEVGARSMPRSLEAGGSGTALERANGCPFLAGCSALEFWCPVDCSSVANRP